MPATIDPEFASKYLLRCINDPGEYGVHLLFNEWWRFAPDEARDEYLSDFKTIPEYKAFVEEGYYADTVDLDAIGKLPEGTLGRAYHHFIVDNDLQEKIALDYRALHEHMEKAGRLEAMPGELRYAILRGFQVHDFLHVVTGYDSSPGSELALQAFSLAQLRFPYFGMWMAVTTTRMTFLDPKGITPVMDAISSGWQFGRHVKNLSFEKWEDMLDQPLADVRARFDVAPEGMAVLAA